MSAPELSALARHLDTTNIIAPAMPVKLTPETRLQQLLALGGSPNWEFAQLAYAQYIVSKNIEGIQLLYRTGQKDQLLGPVTNFLFLHTLSEDRPENPLQTFQKLITPDLISRLHGDDVPFAYSLIGQHSLNNPHYEKYRQKKEDSRLDVDVHDPFWIQMNCPIQGLRAYVSEGLLDLDDAILIEDWILNESGLKVTDDARKRILGFREEWLTLLKTQVEALDAGEESTDPAYLEQKFWALHNDNPLGALSYFSQLTAAQRWGLQKTMTQSLLIHGHEHEARTMLDELTTGLLTLALSQEDRARYFADLVKSQVLCANTEGIITTFKAINEEQFNAVLQQLGVDENEFPDLLFLSYYFNAEYESLLESYPIESFLQNPDQRGEERLYALLVAARIYLHNEEGLNYPAKEVYEKNYTTVAFLAFLYGRQGNFEKYMYWLKKALDTHESCSTAALYKIKDLMIKIWFQEE